MKDFNDFKAFIQHSNVIDNIYKNIEDYNLNKKRKILIVFEDMIADVLSTKRYETKLYALFSYESSKYRRTLTN